MAGRIEELRVIRRGRVWRLFIFLTEECQPVQVMRSDPCACTAVED